VNSERILLGRTQVLKLPILLKHLSLPPKTMIFSAKKLETGQTTTHNKKAQESETAG